MLLGFCVQLLNEGLDVVRLGALPHHIAAFCVPWVMPAAFLTAVIMAFARMAADNEIIAVRVGGVHLFHLMIPICVAGLILSGIAAYFHFRTVPRARREIERLKYTAIKQMLRDRVALSAQRQFSFAPCTVQYEDYEQGKMQQVLILESGSDGLPNTIITADTGQIVEDKNRPGYMKIELRNCAITQLAEGNVGGEGTWNAQKIELPIRVTSELSDIGSDVEHLGVWDLIERYKKLRETVQKHPVHFRNPDGKDDEIDRKRDKIASRRMDVRKAINAKQKRLEQLQTRDKRRLNHTLEQKKNKVEQTRKTIQTLKEQQQSYTQKLQKLRKKKDKDQNYDEITALQKQLRATSKKLKAKRQILNRAQKKIQTTKRQIQRIGSDVEMLRRDISTLETEREKYDKKIAALNTKMSRANEQEDFREMRVRIHRRLALSLAILFFAIVGMPLGILTRRRSTMVAFGVGFAIMILLFYPFLIFGQIAAEVGMLPVPVAMWSGNAVTFLIGMGLMIKLARH